MKIGFLIGSPASPNTSQDTPFKTFLEGKGHVVTYIDDAELLTHDYTQYDIVLVSETCSVGSGYLNKIISDKRPAVLTENHFYGQLIASSDATAFLSYTINITNNTHYITQPFLLGDLQVYSSSSGIQGVYNLLPGTTELAKIGTNSALVVQEYGGVRYVFFGPYLGNVLTDIGRDLFYRSIEWAVGVKKAIINIDTIPVKGEIFINVVSQGFAPVSVEVDAGTYTVSFGDVAGYTTPSAQTITVLAGEIRDVLGTYTAVVVARTINVSIQNTGNTAWNYGVGCSICKNVTGIDCGIACDGNLEMDLAPQSITLSPGSTGSLTFNFDDSGLTDTTHYAIVKVWREVSLPLTNCLDGEFTSFTIIELISAQIIDLTII